MVNLGYTRIVAPMDGQVVAVVTQEGQTVNANQAMRPVVAAFDKRDFDDATRELVDRVEATVGALLREYEQLAAQLAIARRDLPAALTAAARAQVAFGIGLQGKAALRHRPADADGGHHVVQALGGAGFLNDSVVSRLFRDAKLMEIGAGTSEIRRMLIGRELFAETM